MKKQVLFVDDEPNILNGLRRSMQSQRSEWDVHFALSGPEALEILESRPLDMIISDMRMSPMSGAELMLQVMQKHPDSIRIILSGHADPELISQSVSVTHQFISKPCDPEDLKLILSNAFKSKSLLENENVQFVVSQLGSLPSLPSLYMEMTKELQSSEPSIQKIGNIVSKDPAMTAKILQLGNSAFFGRRQSVSNAIDAVTYLGIERIQNLFLAAHAFSLFEPSEERAFSIEQLWEHSFATASLAQKIAMKEKAGEEIISAAYTAGLLHDIGKLMLSCKLPEKSAEAVQVARSDRIPLWQAEQQVLLATHAEVGAYLLGLWGLPESVVEATAYHHRLLEATNQDFSVLTVLHAADCQVENNCYAGMSVINPEKEYLSKLLSKTEIPEVE